ncbi:MAG TPA: hypothetical protein DCG51_03020 [Erysipelotrichaceae bacterium]|nr:hypothetical protein [Erysipelotrichaceae bacterium]
MKNDGIFFCQCGSCRNSSVKRTVKSFAVGNRFVLNENREHDLLSALSTNVLNYSADLIF